MIRIKKGDRVRITIPPGAPACNYTFGPGWCEGTVITADHWGGGSGWYVEIEKDAVGGRGWRTGYGYWKQGEDGGDIELIARPECLVLTEEDYRAIKFVAGRYNWSAALLGYNVGVTELTDEEWRDLITAFKDDMEGDHSPFPMLASDSKLHAKLSHILEAYEG